MRPDIVEHCRQFAAECDSKYQGEQLTVVATGELPKFDGDPTEVEALAERLIMEAIPALGSVYADIDSERRLEVLLQPASKLSGGDKLYCEVVVQECAKGYFDSPRINEFEVPVPSYQMHGRSADILEYAIRAIVRRLEPNNVAVQATFERAPDRMKVKILDR